MERYERLLCCLLKCALLEKPFNDMESYTEYELDNAVKTAMKHSVLPLLYDTLNYAERGTDMLESVSLQTIQQSYHLLFLSKYVADLLLSSGIKVILLKGSSTAALYPVPELRKSGDVDLLFENRQEAGRACVVLKKAGFNIKKEQHAHHHIACISPDGIDVELHSMLVEPFDSNRVNNYLEKVKEGIFKNTCTEDILGVRLPVLSKPFHAFYLLLHMLQHFLRSGFGLKLMCDWVVFWNMEITKEDKEVFLKLVKESGTYGFAGILSQACVYYLGLERDKVSFILDMENNDGYSMDSAGTLEFMKEVFEAGEFGKSSPDRMVVLRSKGILLPFIREFHHQMKLNYPKAGRIVFIWPVLWVLAFAGFIHRNKSIRNVTGSAIIKKAVQRSFIVEKMKLFKKMK